MTKNQKILYFSCNMYLWYIYSRTTKKTKVLLDLATTWNDPETEDRYALLKEVLL